MGTPGQTVKCTNPKSRVGVAVADAHVSRFNRFRGAGKMEVQVGVTRAVMLMGMGMDPQAEGLPGTPDPETDQQDPHQPFAHRRNGINGEEFPKHQGQNGNECQSRGMPQSPAYPGTPGAMGLVNRQRRNRRQMVRPGQHMEKPRRHS